MNLIYKITGLPGKLKGLFFYFRGDRFIPINFLFLIAHLAELSKWISKHKKECKNDFYTWKFNYQKRESLYERIITEYNLDSNIDYIEFGVSAGHSFRWWVNRIKNVDARFYGFDTFTGLPEDWGHFKKGDMSNGNKPTFNR